MPFVYDNKGNAHRRKPGESYGHALFRVNSGLPNTPLNTPSRSRSSTSYTYAGSTSSGSRGCISGIIALVTMVAIVCTAGFFILNNTGTISSNPDWALSRFCDDINGGNLNDAFNRFSSNYQQNHSQTDFVQTWSKWNLHVGSCVHTVSTSTDGKTIATLTIEDFFTKDIAVYHVTFVQNNLIDWKLDSISS
jgi:hypothetical protein